MKTLLPVGIGVGKLQRDTIKSNKSTRGMSIRILVKLIYSSIYFVARILILKFILTTEYRPKEYLFS